MLIWTQSCFESNLVTKFDDITCIYNPAVVVNANLTVFAIKQVMCQFGIKLYYQKRPKTNLLYFDLILNDVIFLFFGDFQQITEEVLY